MTVERSAPATSPSPPSGADDKPPVLPMLPTISLAMWRRRRSSMFESVFLRSDARFLSSGTSALAAALRLIDVRPGDRVLLPAYHCRTAIVEPVRETGAEAILYPLLPDLRPDVAQLRRLLERPARALVLVHFFGFPNDVAEIENLCASSGMPLIEDCAHAFFGPSGSSLPGQSGDYAITSAKKFFPCPDGGMLVTRTGRIPHILLSRARWSDEVRGLFDSIQAAAWYGKLGLLSRPIKAFFTFLHATRGQRIPIVSAGTGRPNRPRDVADTTSMHFPAGQRVSRCFIRLSSPSRVAESRRQNYEHWLRSAASISGAVPLYPSLPANVVPYVFPLLLDQPARAYAELRRRGMPMYRWDDLAPSACAVSRTYQYRLIQLPCHQELNPGDIDAMAAELKEVLAPTDRQHRVA